MPTRMRHRHRVGHGPSLQHSPPHSWTGPDRSPPPRCLRSHPQGAADRRARRHPHHGRPLQLGHAVPDTNPDTIGNIFRNSLDGPERHNLQRHHRHVAPAGRHTRTTGRDITRNQPGLQLRRRRLSSHYLLQSKPNNSRRRKKVWRQPLLLHRGAGDGVEPQLFLECTPDKLASADTWHQFLFSTRVAGLDAGARG